ncbi:hypothetical protein FSP39_019880 [Pinctada imbricata]|uniref:EF-hand domain-containing protein n=1 Tax=Pinctada imbricata TaxID=66713 RepID=A0AA88XQC5_PINIB|nr:hypothetical protein FSP39_019880 [Pinctada imbricata]
MDANGDDRISVSEFKKAAKSLGQDVTTAEVKAMFSEVDDNGDGYLNYKEFEAMMVDRMEAAAMEDKYLQEMFSQMDLDKNGRVSYKEIAKTLGISKEEAKELIKEADTSGDGKINFEGTIYAFSSLIWEVRSVRSPL